MSSGKKRMEREAQEGPSNVTGASAGKRGSALDTISQSLAGLIELQNKRIDLEIQWRKEDKE